MTKILAITGFVCLVAASSQAAEVRRATSAIRVDAQLDEGAWNDAATIPIAYEWFPADDAPAPVETAVLVTFDDRNLYVAFRAHDPKPERIRARYQERDRLGEDDAVGIYIDPFRDARRAYLFRVNPLGAQLDALYSDLTDTQDRTWDGVWESAGRVTADGYIVEMAIPLQQLRIPAREGPQSWGFLAMREWPRDVVHRLRSAPTDQDRNCFICQFPAMGGFEIARQGRNVEVTPTLTGSMAEARTAGGDFTTIDDGIEPGISARWAFTPGTSLQATLNPDFSQVEADAAQLDVNTRFATSYPEKRPFFIEGADFFQTRLQLLFTRTIADPDAGLKLTGKSGPHAYGALFTRDAITNVLVPSDQGSFLTTIRGSSSSGIMRYRRELGANASLGGFLSTRRGEDGYESSVLAADSFHRLTERDSLRVQVAGSRSDYPDALAQRTGFDRFHGHALSAGYSRTTRNWSLGAAYVELSPGFRADAGLINQVGVRAASGFAERRIRGGPERWFSNIYVSLGADATREWNGSWNEWGSDFLVRYQGPRQSNISIAVAPNQEHHLGTTYQNFRHSVSASFQPTADLTLGLGARWGEAIDFTNRRQAEFVTLSPTADLRIGRRFSAGLLWDHQTFDTTDGRRIFTVSLPQARLLYHFSGRAFVRTIVQYRSVDRDPLLYVVPVPRSQRNLLTQILGSYRVNAQTVVLAGYSDTYGGATDLTQTARTVFAKLSYAWLF